MSQSLSKCVLHCVFSTKDRYPFLEGDLKNAMHGYLATVARDLGCDDVLVGGMFDHVHLALTLPRTLAVSVLMEKLKTPSSKWAKTQDSKLRRFAWQKGYGAFFVSPKDLGALRHYIENQEEHHRVLSFQDEFRRFLKRYDVPFDERYVWE